MLCANGEYLLKLRYGAARCDYAHVRLELAYAPVGIGRVFDGNAHLREAVAYNFGDIFADVVLVAAERADQLAAVLENIAHEIAAHFACAVLNYSYFAIHIIASLFFQKKIWLYF